MAGTVSGYNSYLNELANNLMAQTGQINYQPQSASSLKSALAKYIRPSYDKEIQSLQESNKSNSAAIDADAAARGLGSSTWATDAKSKQQSELNKNVRGVESDYNSALYNALINRMQSQDELSQQAQYYNQAARANALSSAATPAWNLYQASLTPTVVDNGGSSYSYSSTKKNNTNNSDLSNYGLTGSSSGSNPSGDNRKYDENYTIINGKYIPVQNNRAGTTVKTTTTTKKSGGSANSKYGKTVR